MTKEGQLETNDPASSERSHHTDQKVEEVRAACAALVASLQADIDQASGDAGNKPKKAKVCCVFKGKSQHLNRKRLSVGVDGH